MNKDTAISQDNKVYQLKLKLQAVDIHGNTYSEFPLEKSDRFSFGLIGDVYH